MLFKNAKIGFQSFVLDSSASKHPSNIFLSAKYSWVCQSDMSDTKRNKITTEKNIFYNYLLQLSYSLQISWDTVNLLTNDMIPLNYLTSIL